MSTLKIKRENGKIFCPLADSWHIETPEEKVRQEYIKILVENYGYSLDQMAQEIKVNNSQRGQGKARADIYKGYGACNYQRVTYIRKPAGICNL